MSSDSVLNSVSNITEFNDLSAFMQDEDLDEALRLSINLMVNPNVPPDKVAQLIIKMQAYGAKFALLATLYSTTHKGRPGSEEANKKNIYYTLSAELDKLVQALKYILRGHSY